MPDGLPTPAPTPAPEPPKTCQNCHRRARWVIEDEGWRMRGYACARHVHCAMEHLGGPLTVTHYAHRAEVQRHAD